jgi:hypothetical protein
LKYWLVSLVIQERQKLGKAKEVFGRVGFCFAKFVLPSNLQRRLELLSWALTNAVKNKAIMSFKVNAPVANYI